MKSQQQEKTIQVVARGPSGAPGQVVAKAKNISTGQESTPRKEKWRANQRFVFRQRLVLVFIEERMVKFCQTKVEVNINGAPGQVVAKARQQSREQESTKRQEKSTGKERIVFGQRMVKFRQTKIQKNFNGARGQAAIKAKE